MNQTRNPKLLAVVAVGLSMALLSAGCSSTATTTPAVTAAPSTAERIKQITSDPGIPREAKDRMIAQLNARQTGN